MITNKMPKKVILVLNKKPALLYKDKYTLFQYDKEGFEQAGQFVRANEGYAFLPFDAIDIFPESTFN